MPHLVALDHNFIWTHIHYYNPFHSNFCTDLNSKVFPCLHILLSADGPVWTWEVRRHTCNGTSTAFMWCHSRSLGEMKHICWIKPKTNSNIICLTSTLVMTPSEKKACSVFVSQACLCTTRVCERLHARNQLNANNADMEKVVLSHDVITKMLVKQKVHHSGTYELIIGQ